MRNRAPVTPRVLAAALGLVALASGCTATERSGSSAGPPTTPAASSPSSQPEPRVLGFTPYLRPRASFEAHELVTLQTDTFARTGPSLRLGDAVTAPVVDPDKSLVALGGYNFGKVLVVDPATLEVRERVQVARRAGTREVHVVAWPRRDRLLGFAQESAAHSLLAGRAFVADPQRAEPLRSVALHGSVLMAAETARGVAFLVAPVTRAGTARVVLMDVDGNVRIAPLRQIEAGYVDPAPPATGSFRQPALVAVRDAVYVFGSSEEVAEVGVRSGSVAYHSVPGLMGKRLPRTTYPATGSAGARESVGREAVPAGGSRVLVSGRETHVLPGGARLRMFERVPQIVDVDTWRVRRTYEGVGDARLAGRTVLGRATDGDLVALRPNGDVLYRRSGRRRSWIVVGDRLLEAAMSGRAVLELDIRTGRVVSDLGDIGGPFSNALVWPPKASRAEWVTL